MTARELVSKAAVSSSQDDLMKRKQLTRDSISIEPETKVQKPVVKQSPGWISNHAQSPKGTRVGLRLIELGLWFFALGILCALAFCNATYLDIHSYSWMLRIAVWFLAVTSLLVTLVGLGFCFSVSTRITNGRWLVGGAIVLAAGFVFFVYTSRSIGQLPSNDTNLVVNARSNLEVVMVGVGIAQIFGSLGLIAELMSRVAYFVYRHDLAESLQKDQIMILVSGVATLLTLGIYVMQDRLVNRMGEEVASNILSSIIGFCVFVGVLALIRMAIAIRQTLQRC
jgi:hypothetical protein